MARAVSSGSAQYATTSPVQITRSGPMPSRCASAMAACVARKFEYGPPITINGPASLIAMSMLPFRS
jgi:hypothetical protein